MNPDHIDQLREALAASYYGTYHVTHDLNHNARKAAFWARITRPVRELAETARLPLGLVLMALGKGV